MKRLCTFWRKEILYGDAPFHVNYERHCEFCARHPRRTDDIDEFPWLSSTEKAYRNVTQKKSEK